MPVTIIARGAAKSARCARGRMGVPAPTRPASPFLLLSKIAALHVGIMEGQTWA